MIPVFQPSYDEREEQAVAEVLRSRWVGLGPKTEEFEEKFAKFVGAKYAVALNSATSALHIALDLLGIGPKHEVIVPTLTFASTAHTVKFCGATPVFADIFEPTLFVDWDDVTSKITSRTGAVIPVLYGGVPEDWNSTETFIWDCAHACGAKWNASNKLCTWSFHAVKNLATGDGGMITTHNKDHYDRARRLRWMGIDKSTYDREVGSYNWEYTIPEIGYKYHMNDLTAAIGIVQLEKLPEMNKSRRFLAACYRSGLKELYDDGYLIMPDWNIDSSWHLFVIRTPLRDQLASYLRERGISTGVHYKPLHLHPCYHSPNVSLPVAERVWKTLLTLPLFPDLESEKVDMIAGYIGDFFKDREPFYV